MKKYSWPKNHWHWPVELSHQHGVRSGGLVFTGGQADLDKHGAVVNPDDLSTQVVNVLQHVETILTDLGAGLNDLVRLVIYFVGDAAAEKLILQTIADRLTAVSDTASRPTVSTICLPELCYPGMCIELEGVAFCSDDSEHSRESLRIDGLPALHEAYAHVVRCGDLVFTSDMSAIKSCGEVSTPDDLLAQTRLMMEQLVVALEAVGASTDDVLKLNVFYRGDGTADNWAEPARIRANYFADPGPAATGISVSSFAQPGLMSKIAVTAGISQIKSVQTQFAWPDNHWDWTMPLPYKHGNRFGKLIHLGGQVALDKNANVLHPDDIVAQTHIALAYIKTVLAELGASMDDVVKVTTFYQGSASAEALHKNLEVRSAAFQFPGPATSGIPVPTLVYENMVIEIEVIAMID